jgi:hypothetical protein
MKTVFKYHLPLGDIVTIKLPAGAQILDVNIQHGSVYLWALVNSERVLEDRTFRIAGTGHEIKQIPTKHIGTIRLSDGDLVFHVFEILT